MKHITDTRTHRMAPTRDRDAAQTMMAHEIDDDIARFRALGSIVVCRNWNR